MQYERVCLCLCAELITESVCYRIMVICMLVLVAFLNFVPCCASVFLVAPPHRVSHLLLWPPTRICLMLMKVSVAQIKPKAWKSVKQIAICFLSHAAWQEKETDSERRREGRRETRHRHRTSSIAFCGRAHVYFIQPYIYYILAQPYTVCRLCRAALSMILTCSLRSRLPAAC